MYFIFQTFLDFKACLLLVKIFNEIKYELQNKLTNILKPLQALKSK